MAYNHKKGMLPLRTERFGDRVVFAGNLDKNDLSITLSDVQMEDEGIYNCYVRNPPDRIQGKGSIQLNVVTERRDTPSLVHPSLLYESVLHPSILPMFPSFCLPLSPPPHWLAGCVCMSARPGQDDSVLSTRLLIDEPANPSLSLSLSLSLTHFIGPVPPPRDSTIAVAIGAAVGGILALLILSMVVVKCLRHHRKQELVSEEQKIEEEGKLDPEGGAEEGTK